MQSNELTHLVVALLAGMMLGVLGTVAAYTAVGARPGEAERQEAAEALKEAQEERNEAVAKLQEYADAEQHKNQNVDLGGGSEDVPQAQPPAFAPAVPQQHPEAAAQAPRGATGREVAPAPRAQPTDTAPVRPGGFGPPKHYGD